MQATYVHCQKLTIVKTHAAPAVGPSAKCTEMRGNVVAASPLAISPAALELEDSFVWFQKTPRTEAEAECTNERVTVELCCIRELLGRKFHTGHGTTHHFRN